MRERESFLSENGWQWVYWRMIDFEEKLEVRESWFAGVEWERERELGGPSGGVCVCLKVCVLVCMLCLNECENVCVRACLNSCASVCRLRVGWFFVHSFEKKKRLAKWLSLSFHSSFPFFFLPPQNQLLKSNVGRKWEKETRDNFFSPNHSNELLVFFEGKKTFFFKKNLNF